MQLIESSRYELFSYFGCCGCQANYFDRLVANRVQEEVVYHYNCSGHGIPTKFVFNYSAKGKILNYSRYIATLEDDFEMEITPSERELFAIIERDSLLKNEHATISLNQIKGFRALLQGELGHSFPLIKRGVKLQVANH